MAAGHPFAKEKPQRSETKSAAAKSAAQLERIGEEAVSRELAAKLRSVKLTSSCREARQDVNDRLEAMSEAEKRALLVDLLAGDWSQSADKAKAEMHRHLLKLAQIDRAKVANAAIDEAKRKAAEAKSTPKPPMAAKVVRAPKSGTEGR